MTKGTPSMGRRSSRSTHIICRRCGRHSYHKRHRVCASCGFGKTAKIRKFAWHKH